MEKRSGVSRRWFIAQLDYWKNKIEENWGKKPEEKQDTLTVLKENVLPMTTSMTPADVAPIPAAVPPKIAQHIVWPLAKHPPDAILPNKGGLIIAGRRPEYARALDFRDMMNRMYAAGRIPAGVPEYGQISEGILAGKPSRQALDSLLARTGIDYAQLMKNPAAMRETRDALREEMLMNMRKQSGAYNSGVHDTLVKNGLSLYDLLGLLPGGSLIEGAIKPSEGASRAETMALGGGGGLLGTALGGLAGAAATSRMVGDDKDRQLMFSLPAAGAGAIGVGALGNIIGRWLAERKKSPETINLEEIKAVLEQANSGRPGSNVTINMADKPVDNKEEINHG